MGYKCGIKGIYKYKLKRDGVNVGKGTLKQKEDITKLKNEQEQEHADEPSRTDGDAGELQQGTRGEGREGSRGEESKEVGEEEWVEI